MEHWGNALAALVDDEGNLKGTGFVCNAGFLITCAHVLEDAGGVGSRVTAIFDVGKNRHQLPFRIAPGGWFPRHAPRLCDEPDELCDVAILMPIDSGVSPVLGPAIATPSPVSGNVVLTGYFPVSNGDRRKETVRAVLQPGRDEPGWLRAKPPDPWSNAPIGGMSGSPAFPDSYEGVVGMLAEGQEEGRGLWLLIPAEVLTRAISIVVQQRGAQPAGRKLWLRQTVAKDAVDRYATCELSSSRQRHQPGEPLSVDFEAYFHAIPDDAPRLRQVEVGISLANLRIERRLAVAKPHQCPSGIEIQCVGRVGSTVAWTVRAPEADRTLHGRNAVPADEAPLFELLAASPGQCLTLRMVAFANKDFVYGEDISGAAASDQAISRMKKAIIKHLKLKEIGEPLKNGELVICVTDNVVEEVPE